MPRLSLKPDSSFFRKIAVGAVGTRAVCADLLRHGHEMVELERGSLDTKLWKEVKRKRVRIPDLVCKRCGVRVECRTKAKAELSMSHSLTDAARAWDFGMVDSDWIAFPVCGSVQDDHWSTGHLGTESSYWHEKNWVRWQCMPWINYFDVAAFRSTPHVRIATKGVTEGSETTVAWPAILSTDNRVVLELQNRRITLQKVTGGRPYTRTIPSPLQIFVRTGDTILESQIIASAVAPLFRDQLACPARFPEGHIAHLLSSRERTLRFTGVKLARLRRETDFQRTVAELVADEEEDVYVRLEGASYLCSVAGQSARGLFERFLASPDEQTQLETIIALGEGGTEEAVQVLCEILDNPDRPYFLRSGAAWSLSRVGNQEATKRLVRAFSDISTSIRAEALEGIVSIGGTALPFLLAGLREVNEDIAAGCAEALRQQQDLPESVLSKIAEEVRTQTPSKWTVWLLGNLPRESVATTIAELQQSAPQLHYAISLLWCFVESWIARHWELHPGPDFPRSEDS